MPRGVFGHYTIQERARSLVRTAAVKLLAGSLVLQRTSGLERHTDEVMDIIDMLLRNKLGHDFKHQDAHRGGSGWSRKVPADSWWQRCRVTTPGLPYSGQTFWTRGKPVLLSGLGRDVWTNQTVEVDEPKKYVESNLYYDGRCVYVEHEMIERMSGLKRFVSRAQLIPSSGSMPPDEQEEAPCND